MEETESWSELSAQELIEKKDSIEAEIKAQNDILEGVSERYVYHHRNSLCPHLIIFQG